jgi:hypothetical protein
MKPEEVLLTAAELETTASVLREHGRKLIQHGKDTCSLANRIESQLLTRQGQSRRFLAEAYGASPMKAAEMTPAAGEFRNEQVTFVLPEGTRGELTDESISDSVRSLVLRFGPDLQFSNEQIVMGMQEQGVTIDTDAAAAAMRKYCADDVNLTRDLAFDRLKKAALALYTAAYWFPRADDELTPAQTEALWSELRDAAGILPGTGTAIANHELTPAQAVELQRADPDDALRVAAGEMSLAEVLDAQERVESSGPIASTDPQPERSDDDWEHKLVKNETAPGSLKPWKESRPSDFDFDTSVKGQNSEGQPIYGWATWTRGALGPVFQIWERQTMPAGEGRFISVLKQTAIVEPALLDFTFGDLCNIFPAPERSTYEE